MSERLNIEIAKSIRLASRLKYIFESNQKITLLVGSAISMPSPSSLKGVPPVDEMIQIITESFTDSSDLEELHSLIKSSSASSRYQAAMKFVIESRGQGALNSIIKQAVLRSRLKDKENLNDNDLENDISGWNLPPAVDALGHLIAKFPRSFSSPILTSNFDPLLEVAIRKHGRSATSVGLPSDGNFFNVSTGQSSAQVVHFHGSWLVGDMLHTPSQLNRDRPRLKGALRTLLRDTILVVIGYGGWEDVFTKTLFEVISEHADPLDVLWCFRDEEANLIQEKNPGLLGSCEPLLGQRLILYSGVDCHVFFPNLVSNNYAEKNADSSAALNFSENQNLLPDSLSPPSTSFWVGRKSEIEELVEQETGIATIHGFGGVGKSSLASQLLGKKIETKKYRYWAWVDCREQSNTIITHMNDLIAAFSSKNARPTQQSDQEVVSLFVDYLLREKAIIVFDNIDSYVDLESKMLIGALKDLVDKCSDKGMSSMLVLTCRPQVNSLIEKQKSIHLDGLSCDEIRQLFLLRVKRDVFLSELEVELIHKATKGNSLQINLIATQISQSRITINDLISKIKNDNSSEFGFSILDEIWCNLNDKQRVILRYLAESNGTQPMERLQGCLQGSMTPNRINRSLSALSSMDVVVQKSVNGTMHQDLHPLIRSYVRNKFTREERKPYINKIVSICDRMILMFRSSLDKAPQIVFDYWISKAELSVEAADSVGAIDALSEITAPLLGAAQAEEFVRLCTLVAQKFKFDVDEQVKAKWDHVFERFTEQLAYLNRKADLQYWIELLRSSVEGKSARYILLCEIISHSKWILGDFEEAIESAQKGVTLKKETDVDSDFDCSHTLALALRDSGKIDEALPYFLKGNSLDHILSATGAQEAHSSSFWGNIGRSLHLQGKVDQALILLKRSAVLLISESGHISLVNRGWAAYWISDILNEKKDYLNAFCAASAAAKYWSECYPVREREARSAAASIREKFSEEEILPVSELALSELYKDWIQR